MLLASGPDIRGTQYAIESYLLIRQEFLLRESGLQHLMQ